MLEKESVINKTNSNKQWKDLFRVIFKFDTVHSTSKSLKYVILRIIRNKTDRIVTISS